MGYSPPEIFSRQGVAKLHVTAESAVRDDLGSNALVRRRDNANLVIRQIEGNTLVPFVMNRVVALNPLTIIIALVLGTAVLGIPGAILSVPAAAILQVLMLRIVVPAIRGGGLIETENEPRPLDHSSLGFGMLVGAIGTTVGVGGIDSDRQPKLL